MRRTVKLGAQPFVGIENDAVGLFNTAPQRLKFGTNHGRPCPRRIDMNIKIVPFRHGNHARNIITRANAGPTRAGDHTNRDTARGNICFNRMVECITIHRV